MLNKAPFFTLPFGTALLLATFFAPDLFGDVLKARFAMMGASAILLVAGGFAILKMRDIELPSVLKPVTIGANILAPVSAFIYIFVSGQMLTAVAAGSEPGVMATLTQVFFWVSIVTSLMSAGLGVYASTEVE